MRACYATKELYYVLDSLSTGAFSSMILYREDRAEGRTVVGQIENGDALSDFHEHNAMFETHVSIFVGQELAHLRRLRLWDTSTPA